LRFDECGARNGAFRTYNDAPERTLLLSDEDILEANEVMAYR